MRTWRPTGRLRVGDRVQDRGVLACVQDRGGVARGGPRAGCVQDRGCVSFEKRCAQRVWTSAKSMRSTPPQYNAIYFPPPKHTLTFGDLDWNFGCVKT